MKGPVFGRYSVETKLASGGMGEVYLARESSTDQPVILKVLRRDLIRDQQVVLQFLDEVRISAQLHHPNVVSVFDVGDWQDEIVMAMEYIPGHDAATMLKQAQSRVVTEFPVAVAAQILLDAALGLDYVHGAADLRGNPLKVVHRDVSPQNLMVREDGLTKILDFGVARAEARIVRTMQGVVKGKLSYMSPEQVKGDPLTGQVDQFSLGVVAWELLTVQRLFRGNSDVDTLNMVMEKPVPVPSTVSRHVPPEFDRLVLRMLEREPQHRFANCGEVARALAPFAGGRDAVVKFREALGLPNPSERLRRGSMVTEGHARVSSPRASPAAPPRASPAVPPRASPGGQRPRSVPPRLPAPVGPIPSDEMAARSTGTEKHRQFGGDEVPEHPTHPPGRPGLATAFNRAEVKTLVGVEAFPQDERGGDRNTLPPEDQERSGISITEPGGRPPLRAPSQQQKTLLLPHEKTTDGAGVPLPPEPSTIGSVPRHPPKSRWWVLALAGVAALGLGAASALAIIKMLLK